MFASANGGGPATGIPLISGFIRRGSRFRGPERTEFQTHNMSRTITPRRSVQFERRPSQRFSRRASYAIKRKLQEQHKLRSSQHQITTSLPANPANSTNHPATNKNESASNLINFSLQESEAPKPKPNPRQSPQAKNGQQNALVPSLSDSKLNPDVQATTSQIKAGAGSSTCSVADTSLVSETSTTSLVAAHCCKAQLASDGAEHDLKCNVYKAHLMKKEQQQIKEKSKLAADDVTHEQAWVMTKNPILNLKMDWQCITLQKND